MASPAPWRSLFHERPQSFEEYVRDCGKRRRPQGSVLVLQPLGDVDPSILDALRSYGAAFFGIEARVADPIPLPDSALVHPPGRHNSGMILDALADRLERDALMTVAVAGVDLFARGKNYVFGESSVERRVGVCSLARMTTPDRTLFLRRSLRLMTHEAAHLLSIAHCLDRDCMMQGANTVEESDGHPMESCGEDRRKLAWSTGVDLARRERDLLGWREILGR
ncbi:MAG TPA: archaemetzincin [Planctomycetota bacterium]|nr:archaemetzincin [Planctomycetota bacterium]